MMKYIKPDRERFRIGHVVFPNERNPRAEPGEDFPIIFLTPEGEDGSTVKILSTRRQAEWYLNHTLKLIDEGIPVLNAGSMIQIAFEQETKGLFLMPRARTLAVARRMVRTPADLARAGFQKVVHEVKPDATLGRYFHYFAFAFGK